MERQELLIEVKKNNNTRVIQEKMAKTFSIRRLEIVSESPAVEDFRDRWPALFCEDGIKEEFRRITTLSLEQSFMYKLDHYTPKLITLMKAKGGVLGTALRPFLYRLSQNQSIEERRDTIIRSLIVYLGEKVEDLFEDCQEDCRSEARKHGHGAQGQNQYEFRLELLHPVKPEVKQRSTQRQVNLTVQKDQSLWWGRLTAQERRPVFLAPDFDRWLEESDAEMEIQEKERREKKAPRRENNFLSTFKTGFLLLYNLVQFLGFSWIFFNMILRVLLIGHDSLYDTFHSMGDVMFFCQILASVEVLNAAFGVVKAGVGPAFVQVVGRNFVLFVIFGSLEEMQNKPVVFFVFLLWSAIEIFRYPFYMLASLHIDWKPLSWLRYSVWIPLYPLGVLAEAVAVVQSIPIFDQTKLFSFPLPKAVGSSLSFSVFLRVYLILMCFGLYSNFKHLYKQRTKRFSAKKRKTH
uniref:Very-long-chain (3R)-3-hydroxyacyl-CoA dehydratase n=1 Tax=Knipowitschia caucasica TaxID=637954 RepID=A0AAV2L5W1_KNICA